jgi:hypothetical protein
MARTLDDYLRESKRANSPDVVTARAVFGRAFETLAPAAEASSQANLGDQIRPASSRPRSRTSSNDGRTARG